MLPKNAVTINLLLLGVLTSQLYGKQLCHKNSIKSNKYQSKSSVYQGMPFRPGEKSRFKLYFSGIYVGFATISILAPEKLNNIWHQTYLLEARTGDWYRYIFWANDFAKAYIQPGDLRASQFFVQQNEKKVLEDIFQQTKFIQFDHKNCKVLELIENPAKPDEENHYDLEPGALDVLGTFFKLRLERPSIGQTQKYLVFSSKKNWWLEVRPEAREDIKTSAGTFPTIRVAIKSFIGQELQQIGRAHAWFARHHPYPLVKLKGKVKIGNVAAEIQEFHPGSPHIAERNQ